MEKKKDYKVVVLMGLLITIICMSVGYAALGQQLTVTGTATIGDAKWDVKITEIEETSKSITPTEVTPSTQVGLQTGGASSAVATGSTTAAFSVQLNAPGDYAEFTVTVSNLGTIDAVLDNLTFTQDATPAELIYTVTPADDSSATTLAANGTETYVVRVEWDSTATDLPASDKSATLVLDYIQAD